MLEIVDVDARDEGALREWYDVWRAGQPHRPPEIMPSWESARVPLATPREDYDVGLIGVREAGRLVGAGLLNLPMADNPTVAYSEVVTHADQPLRHVAELMAVHDVTTVPVLDRADGSRVVGIVTLPQLLTGRARDQQEARERQRVLRVRLVGRAERMGASS